MKNRKPPVDTIYVSIERSISERGEIEGGERDGIAQKERER